MPIGHDDVQDDQQRETGDHDGEIRKPHERQAENARDDRRHQGSDQKRRQEGQMDIGEKRIKARQRDGFLERLHRADGTDIGADAHEGDMGKPQYVRIAHEDLQADNQDQIDIHPDDELAEDRRADHFRDRVDDAQDKQQQGRGRQTAAQGMESAAVHGRLPVPVFDEMRPSGRKSRTRMTSAKVNACR